MKFRRWGAKAATMSQISYLPQMTLTSVSTREVEDELDYVNNMLETENFQLKFAYYPRFRGHEYDSFLNMCMSLLRHQNATIGIGKHYMTQNLTNKCLRTFWSYACFENKISFKIFLK